MNELLDRAVPPYAGRRRLGAVLRDAGVARRRPAAPRARIRRRRGRTRSSRRRPARPPTIDRALAAAGDGGVLHLVTETDLPKILVDLDSGERRELRGLHEVWFDPARRERASARRSRAFCSGSR